MIRITLNIGCLEHAHLFVKDKTPLSELSRASAELLHLAMCVAPYNSRSMFEPGLKALNDINISFIYE